MALGDELHQTQPEPEPDAGLSPGPLEQSELVEQPVFQIVGHAWPAVRYFDVYGRRSASGQYQYVAARRRTEA